jgi:peptidoglycan/LPS O-acetylase OafA/YrhL
MTGGFPDRRYYSLDHWRGLACLSVLVFHASGQQPDAGSLAQELVARLWIGVPVFFVLSGYCITASVIRTRDKGGSIATYFLRRLRRIFPPYWAAVALVACASATFALLGYPNVFAHSYDGFDPIPAPSSVSVWRWAGSLTLTEGWRGHFVPFGGHGWFLGHAWTLGYEEQFYVVAGLMLLLAARRWFACAATVTIATMVIAAIFPHEPLGGFWFNGRWVTFALGIAVYYQLHGAGRLAKRALPLAMLAVLGWATTRPEFGGDGIVTEIATGGLVSLVLIVLYRYDRSLTELRALRPLQWCGLRCYSLYLLHWPIAKAVWALTTATAPVSLPYAWLITVPATLVISLCAAAVFFEAVERPCLSGYAARTRVATASEPEALPLSPA